MYTGKACCFLQALSRATSCLMPARDNGFLICCFSQDKLKLPFEKVQVYLEENDRKKRRRGGLSRKDQRASSVTNHALF